MLIDGRVNRVHRPLVPKPMQLFGVKRACWDDYVHAFREGCVTNLVGICNYCCCHHHHERRNRRRSSLLVLRFWVLLLSVLQVSIVNSSYLGHSERKYMSKVQSGSLFVGVKSSTCQFVALALRTVEDYLIMLCSSN